MTFKDMHYPIDNVPPDSADLIICNAQEHPKVSTLLKVQLRVTKATYTLLITGVITVGFPKELLE